MRLRRAALIVATVVSLLALVPALDIGPDPQGRSSVLPIAVAVLTVALAVLNLVCFVPAWRGGRRASIAIALAQLVGIVPSLPAFFAPADVVSAGGVAAAAVGAVISVALFAVIVFDVSTALIYAAAVTVAVALYAGGVAAASLLVPTEAGRLVQTVAAIVVALLFEPLLRLLRRVVARALYGERHDPAAATLRLAHSHAGGDAVDAAVADVARALRLPRLELWDAERTLAASASAASEHGQAGSPTVDLPLEGGLRLVATLRPGELRLHPDDDAALRLIAVPLTALVRETRLLSELRTVRAALADTREREQQSLYRDLHDAIGPMLTGTLMRTDAARRLLATDSPQAARLLDDARGDLRNAVGELRRVVYRMWPLELDQHGLWDAIAARATRSGATVELPDDRSTLSPAVELATYRIVSEALTNIDRHAPRGAASLVRLARTGEHLEIEVLNDAAHEGPLPRAESGVGLTSIGLRAEELGGSAESGPVADGWRVHVMLPLGCAAAEESGDGTVVATRPAGAGG